MKVSNTLLHSQVPQHGHNPEPVPDREPRTSARVDIKKLSVEIADIESECEAMQLARGSLKDLLLASEKAVTTSLRAYSSNPSDTTLQCVDSTKKYEKEARLRVHTNNDSLAIRSKDLAVLQAQYDEAPKTVVRDRKNALLKDRKKQTKVQVKRLHKAMVELLVTEHLSGMPVGIINYKSFINSRLPTLRDDVEKQVRTILRNLEDG